MDGKGIPSPSVIVDLSKCTDVSRLMILGLDDIRFCCTEGEGERLFLSVVGVVGGGVVAVVVLLLLLLLLFFCFACSVFALFCLFICF